MSYLRRRFLSFLGIKDAVILQFSKITVDNPKIFFKNAVLFKKIMV